VATQSVKPQAHSDASIALARFVTNSVLVVAPDAQHSSATSSLKAMNKGSRQDYVVGEVKLGNGERGTIVGEGEQGLTKYKMVRFYCIHSRVKSESKLMVYNLTNER